MYPRRERVRLSGYTTYYEKEGTKCATSIQKAHLAAMPKANARPYPHGKVCGAEDTSTPPKQMATLAFEGKVSTAVLSHYHAGDR